VQIVQELIADNRVRFQNAQSANIERNHGELIRGIPDLDQTQNHTRDNPKDPGPCRNYGERKRPQNWPKDEQNGRNGQDDIAVRPIAPYSDYGQLTQPNDTLSTRVPRHGTVPPRLDENCPQRLQPRWNVNENLHVVRDDAKAKVGVCVRACDEWKGHASVIYRLISLSSTRVITPSVPDLSPETATTTPARLIVPKLRYIGDWVDTNDVAGQCYFVRTTG
jgi:hypothetical protein